jgi:hypothetical protein
VEREPHAERRAREATWADRRNRERIIMASVKA